MGSLTTSGSVSRQGGVPTVVPPAAASPGQLGLPLDAAGGGAAGAASRAEPRPGAVHIPGWLDLDAQRALVARFREWAAGHRRERHRQRHVARLRDVLASSFLRTVDDALPAGEFDRYVEAVASLARDPYSVVQEILSRVR